MKRSSARIFFTALLIVFVTRLCAQEPEVKLSLQRVSQVKKSDGSSVFSIPASSTFIIDIIVQNSDGGGKIDIENITKSFQILRQIQSSSFVNNNGSESMQATFSLTVLPLKGGLCTIGPVKINAGGKTITSNTVTLEVTQAIKQKGIFATLTVNQKNNVVIGQPITVKLTIYTQISLLNIQINDPEFHDCAIKKINQPKIQNNVKFESNEYRTQETTFTIFPTKDGELVISPSLIRYIETPVSIFDQVSVKVTQSNELKLTVLPLPPHTGAVDGVGEFITFNAQIDKQEAVINEPIKLTLTIEGKANLEQIAIPKLALPNDFKYYDSKTTIQENLETAYTGGKKQFEYVIQINRTGAHQIPPQAFTFYDTLAKTYRMIKTVPLQVMIKQGEGQVTPPPQQAEPDQHDQAQAAEEPAPDKTSEDICFIIEEPPAQQHPPSARPVWLLLLLVLAPVFVINKTLVATLQKNMKKLAGKPSPKAIGARFTAELEQLTKQNNASALYQLFTKYFAARTNTPLSMVTENWIEQYLTDHGWTYEKTQEFLAFMGTCAQLHFSGSGHAQQTTKQLFKNAQYWLLIVSEK